MLEGMSEGEGNNVPLEMWWSSVLKKGVMYPFMEGFPNRGFCYFEHFESSHCISFIF